MPCKEDLRWWKGAVDFMERTSPFGRIDGIERLCHPFRAPTVLTCLVPGYRPSGLSPGLVSVGRLGRKAKAGRPVGPEAARSARWAKDTGRENPQNKYHCGAAQRAARIQPRAEAVRTMPWVTNPRSQSRPEGALQRPLCHNHSPRFMFILSSRPNTGNLVCWTN
jgi:hypothetical protein